MPTDLVIRPAVAADLELATDWLAGAGLPTEDLTASHMDAFFARHGYSTMGRENAPAAIQSTAEFSSLCPGDAVLMCKRLD